MVYYLLLFDPICHHFRRLFEERVCQTTVILYDLLFEFYLENGHEGLLEKVEHEVDRGAFDTV